MQVGENGISPYRDCYDPQMMCRAGFHTCLMEQNINLNVIPTSYARRNLVFLSECQILCVREVREANSEANAVCPRYIDEVYPEPFSKLKINSSKGSG
jgi:hypothetical protein